MTLMETIRAYLGWCPMTGAMRPELAVRSAAAAAAGGQDGLFRAEPGWWKRHHNQLFTMALAASAATAAVYLLIGDELGYPDVWTGLAIGAGGALGFLLGHVVQVFEDFRYIAHVETDDVAVLQFEARVGDRELQGVDILKFNDQDQISEMTVMVRPASGLEALGREMGRRIEASTTS